MPMCNLSPATPGTSATSVTASPSSKMSTGGTIHPRSSRRSRSASLFLVELTSFAMFASSLYLDLPRFRGFASRHFHVQHAVAIGRIDTFRLDVLRQRDHAPEFAIEPLVPIVTPLIVRHPIRARAGNAERTRLDVDVELRRIESGCEHVDVYGIRCHADVHCRKRARTRGAQSTAGQIAEELVE